PEGCASILYREKSAASIAKAAERLRITAGDLLELGVIDEIVREPLGGAHRHPREAMASLREAIERHLRELRTIPVDELRNARYEKFRKIGQAGSLSSSAAAPPAAARRSGLRS
ncbi:MAG: acetyl-CoA carboxylase carboxyl transferase subunit alpha, partial [Candidatus Binatia bacterium]